LNSSQEKLKEMNEKYEKIEKEVLFFYETIVFYKNILPASKSKERIYLLRS
jgi:hypothetical protein